MIFPTIQEYKNAILIGSESFKTLRNIEVVYKDEAKYEPYFISGGVAVVFKVLHNEKPYALKCFYRDVPDRDERYNAISEYLNNLDIRYFVNYQYYNSELWVNTSDGGNDYPIVLMDWVDGVTLDVYLKELCENEDKERLNKLYYEWCTLAWWLHQQDMAHCDLKHDNILVTPEGNLVLVDYDGMYVPKLAGKKAIELGSPDYQHPKRTADFFNERLDDFSIVVLTASIDVYKNKPELFEKSYNEHGLLFTRTDWINLNNKISKIDLSLINNTEYLKFSDLLKKSIINNELIIDFINLIKKNNDWINYLLKMNLSKSNINNIDYPKVKRIIYFRELISDNIDFNNIDEIQISSNSRIIIEHKSEIQNKIFLTRIKICKINTINDIVNSELGKYSDFLDIKSIQFYEKNNYLVTEHKNKNIIIWNLTFNKPEYVINGFLQNRINILNKGLVPQYDKVNKKIKIMDSKNLLFKELNWSYGEIKFNTFAIYDKYFAFDISNSIYIYDLKKGILIKVLNNRNEKISSIVFSSNLKFLVTYSQNHSLSLYDILTGENTRLLPYRVYELTGQYISISEPMPE